jgi:2-dehydro-3-deoxyphosphogluconate aldolase/(4S)-4-hydroxy-2-oxoglutarate aldolase
MDIIEAVNMRGLPVIPGALTATEVAMAYEYGADMVKIFPVSSVGGPSYIKALLAPMPGWELIPTGGVTPENAIEYLRAGAVSVGLGNNLAPKEKVAARDWEAVTAHVRSFMQELARLLKENAR